MNKDRDYVPKRERNLKERMAEGASVKDGLSGRVTAQHDGVHYRTYIEEGKEAPEKKYRGGFFGY
jgi:hypothetical protein